MSKDYCSIYPVPLAGTSSEGNIENSVMTGKLRNALLLLAVITVSLSSTNAQVDQAEQPSSSNSNAFAGYEINDELMGKWTRSCALCHVNGEAGAPVVGDSVAWSARIEQGEETVMRNVLYGLNSMPPLGYCMACEVEDFLALIGFMAGSDL